MNKKETVHFFDMFFDNIKSEEQFDEIVNKIKVFIDENITTDWFGHAYTEEIETNEDGEIINKQ